jgi:hypothetical protein
MLPGMAEAGENKIGGCIDFSIIAHPGLTDWVSVSEKHV